MENRLDELVREVHEAIEDARQLACAFGMPTHEVDALVSVARDMALAAARAGYERGWADARRAGGDGPTPPLTGR